MLLRDCWAMKSSKDQIGVQLAVGNVAVTVVTIEHGDLKMSLRPGITPLKIEVWGLTGFFCDGRPEERGFKSHQRIVGMVEAIQLAEGLGNKIGKTH
jgi:hypothetical protein